MNQQYHRILSIWIYIVNKGNKNERMDVVIAIAVCRCHHLRAAHIITVALCRLLSSHHADYCRRTAHIVVTLCRSLSSRRTDCCRHAFVQNRKKKKNLTQIVDLRAKIESIVCGTFWKLEYHPREKRNAKLGFLKCLGIMGIVYPNYFRVNYLICTF